MTHRTLLATAIVLATSSRLNAQACLGRVSFSTGAVRTAVSYFERTYGGEVGLGRPLSGFASLTIERYNRDASPAFESSSNRGLVSGGTQLSLGKTGAQFCPIAGFGLFKGTSNLAASARFPDFSSDYSGQHYEIGGALGYAGASTNELHFIPSIAVRFVRETTSGTTVSQGLTQKYDGVGYQYGLTTMALGIARNGFAVTPFLQRAFATRGGRVQWGLVASYNFGARP